MKTSLCIFVALVCSAAIASGQVDFRRPCGEFCPTIYDPRCGFNGYCFQEFSNSCQLSRANCRGYGRFVTVNLILCRLAVQERGWGRLRVC